MENYLSLNGKIFSDAVAVNELLNRAFLYGDGFFESLAYTNNCFPLWDYHYSRIQKAFDLFDSTKPKAASLLNNFKELLDHHRHNDLNLRVRFSFYRQNGGLYSPQSNEFNVLISYQIFEGKLLDCSSKGISLGVYQSDFKSFQISSFLKSSSALFYTLAGKELTKTSFDDLLILNFQQQICESISSNIFLVTDNKITTPPLSCGCVAGVYRSMLLHQLPKEGIEIKEEPITIERLKAADEVFLTNAISGIRWVDSFEDKYFGCAFTRYLFEQLSHIPLNGKV